jgi:three-Cys-motif partner protein
MPRTNELAFEEIGYWSEIKLQIIKEYAQVYSQILSANNLHHVYIDAFSGAGKHVSRSTGEFVPGSPLNALAVEPPFKEYFLVDLDGSKVDSLRGLIGSRKDVHLFQGDCNRVLLENVFPHARYEHFRRALCLLDPYGLHLDWNLISSAGEMKSVEIFLNFPVADMNRNVFWRNPEGVEAADIERMNRFWGDDSWRQVAYTTTGNLFGWEEKTDNRTIAEGFRQRLNSVAGFAYVPEPVPMRNSKNAIVYYLFFAAQRPVAARIVTDIFEKYRARRV